jgi:exodeoxyribonuclease VII small subunit
VATKNRDQDLETAPLTFEEALTRLEEVVRVLEDGHIGLDESLVQYEAGVRLLKTCRESLQNAESRIMLLTGIDANGNPVVEPFAEEATSLEEKKESRVRRRSRSASGPAAIRPDPCASTENTTDPEESERQKGLF